VIVMFAPKYTAKISKSVPCTRWLQPCGRGRRICRRSCIDAQHARKQALGWGCGTGYGHSPACFWNWRR